MEIICRILQKQQVSHQSCHHSCSQHAYSNSTTIGGHIDWLQVSPLSKHLSEQIFGYFAQKGGPIIFA